jgi:hypothetical protein
MSDETSGDGFTFGDPPGAASDELPKIDFSTFILSLATSALFHMGMTEGPGGTKGEVNLPLARQSVDTLELLQQKTQGNLSDDEAKLLEGVLYELRMTFVSSSEEK